MPRVHVARGQVAVLRQGLRADVHLPHDPRENVGIVGRISVGRRGVLGRRAEDIDGCRSLIRMVGNMHVAFGDALGVLSGLLGERDGGGAHGVQAGSAHISIGT